MPDAATHVPPTGHEIAAWLIAAGALLATLGLHLLPALLAGLVVHELVVSLASRLRLTRFAGRRARWLAAALLGAVIVAASGGAIVGISAFFRSEPGSVPALLQKMAEILEGSRPLLPEWMAAWLPADADALRESAVRWLRANAGSVETFGREAVRVAAHLAAGMVIGALVALREVVPEGSQRPFVQALAARARRLAHAFRRVVFAQVRIAAINAGFTWLYLDVALPLAGVHLPLAKTLVAVTFVLGLLPILGNLVSNTVIVVISLSHSGAVALGSLAFLVGIHKLEYFLNAHIIGTQVRARAWELLLAMLVMEAAFGLAGVIAAPIYYAYLKDELSDRALV